MDIKTIDIQAKEWFDKTNGNSYFSARVTLNYGMKDAKTLLLPFQYGYGDHYVDMAKDKLIKEGYIRAQKFEALWNHCERNNIILRATKHESCLKRQVVAYGQD